MDVRYAFKIEDFQEIAEVADKFTPRRHATRFALVCVGVLMLIAPFLAGTDFLHPARILLGMYPFAFWLIFFLAPTTIGGMPILTSRDALRVPHPFAFCAKGWVSP
jgi:hypothetical protein